VAKRKPLDPAIEHFLKELKASKRPGHPFNPEIDSLASELADNPEIYYRARRLSNYMESMLLVAGQLKAIVADKLGDPQLKHERYLTVELEEDRHINASVEQEPPYHIYVSTSLYRFCAQMSALLIAGFGVELTDDAGKATSTAAPALSKTEVIRRTKALLYQFVADGMIPEDDAKLGHEHSSLQDIVFYSIMASIIGHEFAHVVMSEERRRQATQTVKPYTEFAERMLRSNVQNLLYTPMHDPDDLVGFGKLDRRELEPIAKQWIEEVTADLIGVDLTRKYQRDHGPGRKSPDIVAMTNMGIHLGYMAQFFLDLYAKHRDPKFPFFSKTYPPIDFRLHCVVSWMYKDPQHPSVMKLINHCQEILNGVLSEPVEAQPTERKPGPAA